MKKDHIRDYATSAFRFYAQEGSKDKYIDKLIEDMRRAVKNSTIGSPTEAALIHKEATLKEHAAELADLEAVEKTLFISNRFVREAVEMVYMRDCWKEIERGDIETRVHYAEIHIPASQAQIYRWLATARREFARERGLRAVNKTER